MDDSVHSDDLELPEVRERLAGFLNEHALPDWWGVRVRAVQRSAGGLGWEMFFVSVEDPGAGGRTGRVAVKRAPAAGPLTPYDISKEARILEALANSDVPVPRLLAWSTDPSIIGRPFSVMEFLEGENPDLGEIDEWEAWKSAKTRSGLADEVLRALDSIQGFQWRGADLSHVAQPGGSAANRMRANVERYLDNLDRHVLPRWSAQPMLRHAGLWLIENAPELPEEDLVLVHGDFRFGNWIWRDGKLVGVLDWERADLGHPMQDLGFLCMPLARQRRPELMGMLVPIEELAKRFEAIAGVPLDVMRLHYYVIYWQFVEAALVPRRLAYAVEDPTQLQSFTAYPELNINTRQLVSLIDDYEAGRHVL